VDITERNKRIKKALAREFGYKNVSVRDGRGTATGWVNVKIRIPKPADGDIFKAKEEARDRACELLEKTGLCDEVGVWYDDMGIKRKEIIIGVKVDENLKREQKRETVEVDKGSYKVIYEGSWTWVKFDKKPDEEVRAKLKEKGFRFSWKRRAWYTTKKVDVAL